MRLHTAVKNNIDPEMFKKRAKRAAHAVAAQAARDMAPLVPFRSGALRESMAVNGRKVQWTAPYAGFVHFGKVMVDEKTGFAGIPMPRYGPDVFRSPRGANKINSGRVMHFTVGESRWVKAAEARYTAAWLQIARKELMRDA